MKDWRTFFKERLTQGGQFILENEKIDGGTNFLIFKDSTDNQTVIKIGLLGNGDLITFEIHNPRTPGFSEQQEREYLYKYSFHLTDGYGGPGLEFTQLNIGHYDEFLKEGLRGKEVQYFKNGRHIKSEKYSNSI